MSIFISPTSAIDDSGALSFSLIKVTDSSFANVIINASLSLKRFLSSSFAFCKITGKGLPGAISLSERILRIPIIKLFTHSNSLSAFLSTKLSEETG